MMLHLFRITDANLLSVVVYKEKFDADLGV